MPQTYTLPEMIVRNHIFEIPLEHAAPNGPTITVFAREVRAWERDEDEQPYLVFFQGGPGSAAPRPVTRSGWLGRALQDYRVLLLDQRGTGLSSPISSQTLAHLTQEKQAAYLSHFRADAIVSDAEWIRRQLSPDAPWAILGQSFGGFCALRYLSAAPEGLSEVFITGGVPSLTRPADDVYRATYPRVETKNRAFFARYPWAQEICGRIARTLHHQDVRLPNGQRLTAEQFQQLGIAFGMSDGFEGVMDLLERAFVSVNGKDELSQTFLYDLQSELSYHTHPIFSILHEAIYAQEEATNWAAERVRRDFSQFDYAPERPFLFTGEMIYPWMLEQYETLKPLREAADILATKSDWPRLYDLERLANNTVPTAALLYFNDMYVDLNYALETASHVPEFKTWITSEYEHNGLRADGERVLDKLIALNRS